MTEASENADLVIEAIPERVDIKESFYQELATLAPGKTIFASNSSTLIPNQFTTFTGRPEKFTALHFANNIWQIILLKSWVMKEHQRILTKQL